MVSRSPLGYMQGGSRCPERAVERQRARWHDPVLYGATPVAWAHGHARLSGQLLCVRLPEGLPRRPRAALRAVSV